MSIRSNLQLPKEHGSWGMFFIPLVLGLIAGGQWHGSVLLFMIAATASFLAREPFMMAWRGWRRRTESGRAPRVMLTYGVIAVIAGVPLLPRFPWLGVLGAAGAALYAWHAEVSMRGEGRSAPVELLAIATSMLTAPAAWYVSTGRIGWTAAWLWLLSFGYFASSVFYVKMRLTAARSRDVSVRENARRLCVGYHAVLAICLTVLPPILAAGYLPVIVRAFWYAFRPTAELNLKQIGWTEVVYSLIFLTAVAIGFPS
jgi:hypothetical protein